MPINFPPKPEIQLDHPPLEEVVCQVRFPPILRISTEEPVDMQEQLRHRFPLLEVEQGVQVQFPVLGNPEAPSAEIKPRLYRFRTSDKQTAVSLTVNFFAVSSTQYKHWNDFAHSLQLAHDAVQNIYQPAFATRIGLRYINRLTLDNTRTQSRDELFDLLCPQLVAMLRGQVWEDADKMGSVLSFTEKAATLNFRVAYETVDNLPNFLLDFDYSETGELPLDGLVERCDHYHTIIYNAFRWCLREEGLERFQPVRVNGGM